MARQPSTRPQQSARAQPSDDLRETLNRLADLLTRPSLPPPRLVADVSETVDGRAYLVEAAVPGLSADEIAVTASGDMLTIELTPRPSAERGKRAYLMQELSRQPAARVIAFPTAIDLDSVDARLEKGILRIQVQKAEGAPSRTIKVAA